MSSLSRGMSDSKLSECLFLSKEEEERRSGISPETAPTRRVPRVIPWPVFTSTVASRFHSTARVGCAMTATVAWLLPKHDIEDRVGAGNLAEYGCIQTLQMVLLEYPITPARERVTGSYHSRHDQAPITATLTTREKKGSKGS
jgi:hypothetical protein